jgi:arsenite methyltransferase
MSMVEMTYLEKVDSTQPAFGDMYDELPLWSAPFGLLMLERVPLRPGMAILDVGTGTGFLAVELAQRCGKRSTVIAVDPWQPLTTRLRRKIEYLDLKNLRLIEQDAAKLELPESSIDVVVSNLGVNNFDNANAVLSKCFQLLRPTGQLLLTTNLVGHMQEFYEIYRRTLIELGLTNRIPSLDAHINHRATIGTIDDQLQWAGFEAIAITEESFKTRFADGSALLRHYFTRFAFLPAWAAVVEPGEVETTFSALERNLNAFAKEQGELALTIPMACIEARKPAASNR